MLGVTLTACDDGSVSGDWVLKGHSSPCQDQATQYNGQIIYYEACLDLMDMDLHIAEDYSGDFSMMLQIKYIIEGQYQYTDPFYADGNVTSVSKDQDRRVISLSGQFNMGMSSSPLDLELSCSLTSQALVRAKEMSCWDQTQAEYEFER